MNAANYALVTRAPVEASAPPGENWTHEPEAEAAVVAACLLSPDWPATWGTVSALVTSRDFVVPTYLVMMLAIEQLAARREPVDTVAVRAELRAMGALNVAGGSAALIAVTEQLVNEIGHVGNVDHHARLIADRAVRRKVEFFGRALAARAMNLGAPIAATLAGSIAALGQVRPPSIAPRNMSADVGDFVDTLGGKRPPPRAPLATGFADFDAQLMGGLRPGSYLFIGLSGGGKTTFTVQMVLHVARTRGPVLFIEHEESRAAMRNKFLATLARLPLGKVAYAEENPTAPNLTQPDLSALFRAINILDDLPLYLYGLDDADTPATVNDALALARAMDPPPVLIATDHLGEVRTRVDHGSRIDEAVKEKMIDMRQGAESMGLVFWTLVHPKAGVARSKMRLGVSDIAGGENTGRYCTGCFFLHDESRHPTRGKDEPKHVPGVLELYSDKLRGPVSAVLCELLQVKHEHRFSSTRSRDELAVFDAPDAGRPSHVRVVDDGEGLPGADAPLPTALEYAAELAARGPQYDGGDGRAA